MIEKYGRSVSVALGLFVFWVGIPCAAIYQNDGWSVDIAWMAGFATPFWIVLLLAARRQTELDRKRPSKEVTDAIRFIR